MQAPLACNGSLRPDGCPVLIAMLLELTPQRKRSIVEVGRRELPPRLFAVLDDIAFHLTPRGSGCFALSQTAIARRLNVRDRGTISAAMRQLQALQFIEIEPGLIWSDGRRIERQPNTYRLLTVTEREERLQAAEDGARMRENPAIGTEQVSKKETAHEQGSAAPGRAPGGGLRSASLGGAPGDAMRPVGTAKRLAANLPARDGTSDTQGCGRPVILMEASGDSGDDRRPARDHGAPIERDRFRFHPSGPEKTGVDLLTRGRQLIERRLRDAWRQRFT
jgi:hypothetical protein